MTWREIAESLLSPIEESILQAFGNAFIEFEDAVYHKFLQMSIEHSLIQQDQFRKYLLEMEAKGYLAPVEFQGRKAWRRLVITTDIDYSEIPMDELDKWVQRAAQPRRKVSRQRSMEHLVTDTQTIAEDILIAMKNIVKYSKRKGIHVDEYVREHIRNMQEALMQSDDKLLDYVQKELPALLPSIKQILRTRGTDFLLLSLRVISSYTS